MTDSVAEDLPAARDVGAGPGNPAESGTPDSVSPESGVAGAPAGAGGLPDWAPLARKHDWRRAQAAASLAHLEPALVGAVTAVSTFQSEVRARRYGAAQRALGSYRDHLADLEKVSVGDAALLRSLAAPDSLDSGLSALEEASNEHDADALAARLEVAQHPLTRAEALNFQGVLHALQGDQERAHAHFTQALDHDAEHYRARMNLGNLALEAGDAAQAEAQYREVLNLAPDYEGAHHNLGVALRRQGKMHQSVSSIRRAQRLSVRRSQQDSRDEIRDKLRTDPRMRLTRNVIFAVLAAVLLLAFLLGRGH